MKTDNPGILNTIKKFFKKERATDFWDTLSQDQKDEILMGIEEIERGETVDYEDYMRKHR